MVREVSAAGDGDSIRNVDVGLMLPVCTVVLRPAPSGGISAGLVIPQVVKVPSGAPVGKDVEEAPELPVNLARGRHDAGQEGGCSVRYDGMVVRIPLHLGARRCLEELVDVLFAQLPVAAYVRDMVAAELVGDGNVDNHVRSPPRLASLMTRRSPRPVLPFDLLTLRTERILRRCSDRP